MADWPNYKNFIYMEDRGFIFAYVPKVACTNWKSLLRYMAGHEDWLDNKLAHDKVNGGLRYLDLEGPDAELLTRADIKKYTMVRDPYTRVLSAYLNKVDQRLPVKPKGEGDYWDDVVRDIDNFRTTRLDPAHFPGITLEVFLRWLRDGRTRFSNDEHWTSQVILLRQPDITFDVIGRFENLPEDSAQILYAMGCSQRFPTQEEVKFAPTEAKSKVKRYHTPVTSALTHEIFKDDFEAFNYPKRLFHKRKKNIETEERHMPTQLPDDIKRALEKKWYYEVELARGNFTKGTRFRNIPVTRAALAAIDVKGIHALDISTMEGMFSVLLNRRGARVMATDSIDNSERLNIVKKVYDVDFEYNPHAPVSNYVDFVLNQQISKSYSIESQIVHGPHSPYGFDLVLSSGVIYHVLSPIDHLVNFRRLCKSGGLVVLETAALLSDEIEMIHDWREGQQIWGGNATWYPSTRALEIFMRAAFLQPLGYTYIRVNGKTDQSLCRIAIIARAVDERPFPPKDREVIGKSELYKNYDFKPILPSARLTGKTRKTMEVNPAALIAEGDLRASRILEHAPLDYDDSDLTLQLDDC